MKLSNVYFDSDKTNNRRKELERMYSEFFCNNKREYFQSCSGSFRMRSKEHWIFNDWSAKVGDNYDVEIDGVPVRILIIGKEGKCFSYSITKPSRWWSDINRHYKITYNTLKDLFAYYPSEDSDDIILTMFTLSNTYSCAFRRREGQTSSIPNSDIQKENCLKLRKKEIEILEPTVIIIQYDGLCAKDLFDDAEHCKGKVYYSKKHNCYIVESSHPCCRKHPWKADLVESVLFLKNNGVVPNIII